MFEQLPRLPDDPILSLIIAFQNDEHPQKVDLGAGVYKDESGNAPILNSVRLAEREHIEQQSTKTYTGIAGDIDFNQHIEKLIYGQLHPILSQQRTATIQTPGSSGGLFVAAQLIKRSNAQATVWLSQPTWDNHFAIIQAAGLKTATYPYYQIGASNIDFDAMMSKLKAEAVAGDVILIHGCCHNPSGADLSEEQWRSLTELALTKGLLPLIDQAYQGFAKGIDEDAYGIRYMAAQLPELIVSYSCSKNFTVYRERTGAISVITPSATDRPTIMSQLLGIARSCYSIPPANGAAAVKRILMSEEKTALWLTEVDAMRERINTMRKQLCARLQSQQEQIDFSYILQQYGMFSFLPLTKTQIITLREQHHIYMVETGRISFTGLTSNNVDYVATAICNSLQQSK